MKYPDGRLGHPLGGVMEQTLNEKREQHGQMTFSAESHVCREPMHREQPAWDANPRYTHLVFCFCLTATPPEE